MKARIISIACILVALLALGSANAATVTMNNNACTGIQGLEINGELYNVNFDTAYSGPDLDAIFAQQAIAAINQQIASQGSNLHYVHGGGATNNAYMIQYIGHSIDYVAGANWQDSEQAPDAWQSFVYTPSDFSPEDPAMFASFSKISAPIPGAVVLFGSSLILIGTIRRRFDR